MRKLNNDELGRLSIEAFKKVKKLNVSLLLDDVRSMHNVGSIFRSADAFRIAKIILTGITPIPPHRDINKAALGATESVDWEYFPDPIQVVREFKRQEAIIICLEQADESTLLPNFEPDPDDHYLLVFGHEVYGVKKELIDQSDRVIEIPQFGTKHSLNISVSAGIVIWDFARRFLDSDHHN